MNGHPAPESMRRELLAIGFVYAMSALLTLLVGWLTMA
jgi:hypothetical protein